MCLKPIVKSYKINSSGKIEILWNSKGFYYETGRVITLKCGKCIECQRSKVYEWSSRICQEASLYDKNCAITLTFREPAPNSVSPRDVQLFLKRLFKNEHLQGVRRFYCGEYGSTKGRPHYHIILFNYRPDDLEYFFSRDGEQYFRSKTIERNWPYGYSLIGNVSFKTAQYVALYMQKQLKEKFEFQGKTLPFVRMSNRPGIGYAFAGNVDYEIDKIYINSKSYNVPRYYDKINFKNNEKLSKTVKIARLKRFPSKVDILTEEREFYAKLAKYKLISPTYIPH